jgi:hypothetical protein
MDRIRVTIYCGFRLEEGLGEEQVFTRGVRAFAAAVAVGKGLHSQKLLEKLASGIILSASCPSKVLSVLEGAYEQAESEVADFEGFPSPGKISFTSDERGISLLWRTASCSPQNTITFSESPRGVAVIEFDYDPDSYNLPKRIWAALEVFPEILRNFTIRKRKEEHWDKPKSFYRLGEEAIEAFLD